MNDTRLQRIGHGWRRVLGLLSSDEPLEERIATFFAILGQVSYEYEAAEQDACAEMRLAGFDAGYAAGYADGIKAATDTEAANTEALARTLISATSDQQPS